jgi:hypothetical protein
MFKDFFERFGPTKGVNIKQRLSVDKAPTWAQFLEHVGGPESAYYRYDTYGKRFASKMGWAGQPIPKQKSELPSARP